MATNLAIRPPELRLEPVKRTSGTTVRAIGRITSTTSPSLEQTLHGMIPRFERVVLDVSSVDYIDRRGFEMLVGVYLQAKSSKCDLEIANTRPSLRDRFRSWLGSVFEGHEDFLGMTPD